ncbi:uncharacterized protein LOC143245784 [Tachypleus tridentatus]|uniref:uncharacterized protein LOC143245784 n=1 Tax=Tachypleus tridentatus TaxID=6853 RepID=UPI003FD1ADF9
MVVTLSASFLSMVVTLSASFLSMVVTTKIDPDPGISDSHPLDSSLKNDGSLNGVEYFRCKPCFGIFVRPEKLTLYKGRRNTSISDRLVRSTSSDEGFLVGKFSSRRRSYDGNHPLSAKGYSLNSKRKYISEEPVTRTMMRSYSGTEGVGVSLTRKQICRSRYYKGNQ